MKIKHQICLIFAPLVTTILLTSCYVKTPILDPLLTNDNVSNSPKVSLSSHFSEVRAELNTVGVTIVADELDFQELNETEELAITERLNEISVMKDDFKVLKEVLVPEKDRYEGFALTLHLTEGDSTYSPPYKHFMINTKDLAIQTFLEKTVNLSNEIKDNTYTFDSISPQHKWDVIDFLVSKKQDPENLIDGLDFHSEATNTETNGKRIRLDVSSNSQTLITEMNNLLLYHSYLSFINSEFDDEKDLEGARIISISTRSTANLSRSKIEQILLCHLDSIPTDIDNIILGDESKLIKALIRNQLKTILYLDVRVASSIPENPSCKELTRYVITLIP
jgi:hypothetical protein